MLTRRHFLFGSTAAMVLLGLRPAMVWGAPTDDAVAFVDKVGRQLIRVVNSDMSGAQQQAALMQIIDRSVDVDGIARFSLGRFWRTTTPDQQTNYLKMFRIVLMQNITGKISEYQSVQLAIQRGQMRGDDVLVSSTVNRPNNGPTEVNWLVNTEIGALKIIDVIAEGTSLRLTQRDDYAAYLQSNHGNVQDLIDAMRRQLPGGAPPS